MLVSVIIPSYNQGRYIKSTIDSILLQDHRPIEIIIYDGASNDETIAVLRSYNGTPELFWCSEPDKGVADAVNKGLQRAHGEILAIQSSDDIYLPGAISAAVEEFRQYPENALVYGEVELIDQDGNLIGRDIQGAFDFNKYIGRFSYIPQATAFFRSDVARQVGGWRSEVSFAADADYWLRIASLYPVKKIDRLMGRYRYHPEQRDKQSEKIVRDWEKTVRDLLAAHNFSPNTKRFAQMGIFLAKYRYAPQAEWFKRTCYLYAALLSNPQAVKDRHFPKRELLLGREPVWKILSRLKRILGFKPRSR
ncbi:MAG TPA: hypothetical protein DDY20_08880 [Desulfobulbaceae bacterium]|nr:hypothetical protein [Desulfobulbaceae bacterium]